MGIFQGLIQLITLFFMFLAKCAEYVFVSILFAIPLWFLYTKLFVVRFDLPQLFYIDFIAITFSIQLLGMLWNISTMGTKQQDNLSDKIIFLPPQAKNDNELNEKE